MSERTVISGRAEWVAPIDAMRNMLGSPASREPAPLPRNALCSLKLGTVLANTYTVLELVGRGGLSEVYRVRHRELGSERAVKILRPEHALDALVNHMMVEEARTLLDLRHPGIVRGHDLMRHGDGRLFIVMHFVSGPTLARQAGPMPLDAVVALARRLAAALAAIHAAGYVHQDISPENVILPGTRPHAAVIVDFGISVDLRSDAARRRPGVFAGKMSFASPEQMLGEPVTQASDLYSLGLVIAAAARGARLNMDRAARRKPPPLPNVPAPLAPILHRLLQPDPCNRPSVRELEELLASLAQGKNPDDGHPRGRLRNFLKL